MARLVLERATRELGHECLSATGGQEAWEMVQSHRPDVVISDWMMPDLSGIELCRMVREEAAASYTYFVLLTGRSSHTSVVEGLIAGADDYLVKPLDVRQLKSRLIVAERITGLHRQLAERDAELERLNAALFEQARTDALTGVSNRRGMEEDLASIHARAVRYGHGYAVALCDIDNFKLYNDRYGHPAGDAVLQAVAAALATGCRQGDRVYRYGGEELLVLLAGQGLEQAGIGVERLRAAVEALALEHPESRPWGRITISAGVAASAADAAGGAMDTVRAADAALYRAKQEGRNRVALAQSPA